MCGSLVPVNQANCCIKTPHTWKGSALLHPWNPDGRKLSGKIIWNWLQYSKILQTPSSSCGQFNLLLLMAAANGRNFVVLWCVVLKTVYSLSEFLISYKIQFQNVESGTTTSGYINLYFTVCEISADLWSSTSVWIKGIIHHIVLKTNILNM